MILKKTTPTIAPSIKPSASSIPDPLKQYTLSFHTFDGNIIVMGVDAREDSLDATVIEHLKNGIVASCARGLTLYPQHSVTKVTITEVTSR